jgi:hypothetical protein
MDGTKPLFSIGFVANPIKTLFDTRARRINGEAKHRMTVDMQEADTGYGKCLNVGCKATFRGGYLEGKPTISEDSALGSPCPSELGKGARG